MLVPVKSQLFFFLYIYIFSVTLIYFNMSTDVVMTGRISSNMCLICI
jgi:hypothetical protein